MKKLNLLVLALLLCCLGLSNEALAQKKSKAKKKKATTTQKAVKAEGEKSMEKVEKKMEVTKDAQVEKVMDAGADLDAYKIPVYEVKGMNIETPQGAQDGFGILLEKVELKDVVKQWKKVLKKTKGEIDGDANATTVKGAVIDGLGEDPIDIFSQMTLVGDGVQLFAAYNTPDGNINSKDHPDKAKVISKSLNDFALVFEQQRMENAYSAEKKKLGNMEGDLKKLMKKNESFHEDIEKYKKLIAEREHSIKVNDEEQVTTKKMIETQTKLVAKRKNIVSLFKK